MTIEVLVPDAILASANLSGSATEGCASGSSNGSGGVRAQEPADGRDVQGRSAAAREPQVGLRHGGQLVHQEHDGPVGLMEDVQGAAPDGPLLLQLCDDDSALAPAGVELEQHHIAAPVEGYAPHEARILLPVWKGLELSEKGVAV
jgi:hypothetical protein